MRARIAALVPAVLLVAVAQPAAAARSAGSAPQPLPPRATAAPVVVAGAPVPAAWRVGTLELAALVVFGVGAGALAMSLLVPRRSDRAGDEGPSPERSGEPAPAGGDGGPARAAPGEPRAQGAASPNPSAAGEAAQAADATAAVAAGMPPPAQPTSCRVLLWEGYVKHLFYAEPAGGGPWIAESPFFKADRDAIATSDAAHEALLTLLAELGESGWEITSRGTALWDLELHKTGVDAGDAVAPDGAGASSRAGTPGST